MQSPSISVIIPTYNAAKYLNTAVKSVLNQTFKNFELLIIDDGSTDNTMEIAKAFDDRRVQYFYQSNQGKSQARNNGIYKSKGRFISFLDADDFYYKTKLKYLLDFLRNNPQIGCVAGGVRRISDNGQIISKKKHQDNKLITIKDLLFGNSINVCSTLIRSEHVKEIKGFDICLKRGEDWDFHYRLALSGCSIVVKKNIVCAYRFRQNAIDKTNDFYCRDMIEVTQKMFDNEALPDDLKKLKNHAFSSTHLRLSARSYASNKMMLGMTNLQKAVQFDPALIENNHKKILKRFVNWIHYFDLENGNVLIKKILNNLPDECKSLRNRRIIILQLKFMLFLKRVKQNIRYRRFLESAIFAFFSLLNHVDPTNTTSQVK
jgi:glycosyltransferase involved in cell wall biosynthesis